ncbi:uncharacterized protein BDR25DRAFT_356921 [Lindgomyces ingoldianus]|uniref:Uncharacterized protein n=1 Tax=Lindgomyces ingoldianus TaxID=673940 RepID=A0ACB6QS63_9PLEO|nr:uncharacterized protein BDR25DRAFT_356921 [Lindgomyces ingoldianus]KAF2469137.1 hypothetical protein BDR25DRAFT_356921 [Lindgomyces ingoldianus]
MTSAIQLMKPPPLRIFQFDIQANLSFLLLYFAVFFVHRLPPHVTTVNYSGNATGISSEIFCMLRLLKYVSRSRPSPEHTFFKTLRKHPTPSTYLSLPGMRPDRMQVVALTTVAQQLVTHAMQAHFQDHRGSRAEISRPSHPQRTFDLSHSFQSIAMLKKKEHPLSLSKLQECRVPFGTGNTSISNAASEPFKQRTVPKRDNPLGAKAVSLSLSQDSNWEPVSALLESMHKRLLHFAQRLSHSGACPLSCSNAGTAAVVEDHSRNERNYDILHVPEPPNLAGTETGTFWVVSSFGPAQRGRRIYSTDRSHSSAFPYEPRYNTIPEVPLRGTRYHSARGLAFQVLQERSSVNLSLAAACGAAVHPFCGVLETLALESNGKIIPLGYRGLYQHQINDVYPNLSLTSWHAVQEDVNVIECLLKLVGSTI